MNPVGSKGRISANCHKYPGKRLSDLVCEGKVRAVGASSWASLSAFFRPPQHAKTAGLPAASLSVFLIIVSPSRQAQLGVSDQGQIHRCSDNPYQNGTSTKPFVVSALSWFDSWNPSDGTWGSVPYGTSGSVPALETGAGCVAALAMGAGCVAALAMGASATAPPIAAAANHGATYLSVVFMMSSCLLGALFGRCPITAL